MEEAVLLRFESSIFGHEGRFEEAIANLEQAMDLYRSIGDGRGENWCRLGFVHHRLRAEQPKHAMCQIYSARRWLRSAPNLRQDLYLRDGKIAALCFLHEFSRAALVLEGSQPIYEQFPEIEVQVRLPWMRGKIALGRSRFGESRAEYEHARRLVLETWGDYEASLLALEYGQLYLELGWTREARRLLEQALPVLRARSLPQVTKAEELLAEVPRTPPTPRTPTG